MRIRSIASSLVASLCAFAPADARAATAAPVDGAAILRAYQADHDDIERYWSVDFAPSRLDRMDRFAAEWRERLAALDFTALDADSRIDVTLLALAIERDAAERAATRVEMKDDAALLPFADGILKLEEGRWTLAPLEGEEAAKALEAIADQAKEVKRRVESGRKPEAERGNDAIVVDPVVAVRVADRVDRLHRALDRFVDNSRGFDPELSWWIEKPVAKVTKALSDESAFLRRDFAGVKGEDDDPLIGRPIGRDALVASLRAEMIPYSPEQLIAIGEKQLAWCESEMKKEAAALGCGDDVKAALAKVKSDHAPLGKQDDFVMAQAREAIEFLDAHDLVTIPPLCRETWHVEMMGPDEQRYYPFANYGGQKVNVGYPTDAMEHAAKEMALRGNNVHFTRNVTPHELIPGHHLQGFMADRAHTERRMFNTPFLVEGWALYWEMRFDELGWAKSPADRVGILFWRAHRAARIITSLGYHLGTMKPPEMIEFLVDRVGHERDNATGEVRRWISGGYGPLYQCGYLIGGLQIRALHREAVESGKMSERAFHDAVLAENAIPIEMIRDKILGIAPERDGAARWKFAGDP